VPCGSCVLRIERKPSPAVEEGQHPHRGYERTGGAVGPDQAIGKLVNANVEVHSVENLHAKVFVVGSSAFVGSTNASQNSENTLVEAVIATNTPQVVRECRDFVRSLKGELVSPAYARRMQKLYRPPRFGGGGGRKERNRVLPTHSRLWAVPLERPGWSQHERDAANVGRPKAGKRVRSTRRFRIDEFCWDGSNLIGRLQPNELIIQVIDEQEGKQMVSPQGRVLHVQQYRRGRTRCGIVFVEVPKQLRRKNQSAIVARLGRDAKFLGQLNGPSILRDQAFVHSLLNLW
jgi:hypothetical protein